MFRTRGARSRALIVAVLAVPLMAASAHAAADPRELDVQERWVVGSINDARQAHGLARLQVSRSLTRAAADYAEYMRARRHYGHVDQEGRYPYQRAMAAGWPTYEVSEVINKGLISEEGAFTGWMNSPNHRDTLLSPLVNHIGLGRDTLGDYYWVGVVAGPCPPGREAACEATGDTGDSSIRLGPGPARPKLNPRLRVAIRRVRRALIIRVRARGSGWTRICVRRVGSPYCHAGKGSHRKYVVRVTRGRWYARVTYSGNRRWRSARRTTRIVNLSRVP